MSVRIYVEGGGDHSETLARCRSGFSKFFSQVVPAGRMPKVIACGGRSQTFQDFCTGLNQHPDDTVLLLVDAEDELLDPRCWEHLRLRAGDGWARPVSATEETAYLMVLCMESWFLADKDAVAAFYGKGFDDNALPRTANIESVSKVALERALNHAARDTKKECYHKTQHGFDILASLNAVKVEQSSGHAKRLIGFLRAL